MYGCTLFLLVSVLGLHCCLGDTLTKPGQLFRDFAATQSQNGKNPDVSQSTTSASASASAFSSVSNGERNIGGNGAFNGNQGTENMPSLIASDILQFAHDIGGELSDASRFSKSEVYSPLSIMSALALLLLGAGGKSYQELKNIFRIDAHPEYQNDLNRFHEEFGNLLRDLHERDVSSMINPTHTNWRNTSASNNIRPPNADRNKQPMDHIVRLANGLFVQNSYTLNPDYKYIAKSVYHSELQPLDFSKRSAEARDIINAWVGKKTFGKIPNIINGEIAKDTKVIIANALYFKAFWENSFFESATNVDNFYPNGVDESPIKVKMMGTGGVFPYYDAVEYNCRIIGLPYQRNLTTMYVIQPYESTRAKLQHLQRFLDASKIESMISKMAQKSAVVAFPKMHIVSTINMKNVLNRLGINEIFSSGYSDLSLIGGAVEANYFPESYAEAGENTSQRPQIDQQPPLTRQPARHPMTHTSRRPNLHPVLVDRFQEPALIVSRIGEDDSDQNLPVENYQDREQQQPLYRAKRQQDFGQSFINHDLYRKNSLEQLEAQRTYPNYIKSDMFVEDIVHKVDFNVNEYGTEAAAATLTYLRRSGTDVLFRVDSPFLLIIRHDPTKLVLFYGIINEPEM